MKCPRCAMEMESRLKGQGAESFEIDTCTQCEGIWLDADELNKLDDNFFLQVEEVEFRPTSGDEDDQTIMCPRCNQSMEKVHPEDFSAVIVDTCPQCRGFWLDAGELEKMKDVSDALLVRSLAESD